MIIGGYYFGVMPECIALGAILSQDSLNDVFDILTLNSDKEKTQGDNILKKFQIEYSDHLTLLNIYIQWARHKNRKNFANENKLNNTILNRIEHTCTELQEIITKRLFEEIPDLELFRVIGDKKFLFGGGSDKKKSKSYKKANHEKDHDNRLVGGFNRHAINDNSFSTKNSSENQEVSEFIQRAGRREIEGTSSINQSGFTLNFSMYNSEGSDSDNNDQNYYSQIGGKRKKKKKKKPITQKKDTVKETTKNANPPTKSQLSNKPTTKLSKKLSKKSTHTVSTKPAEQDEQIDDEIDNEIEQLRIKETTKDSIPSLKRTETLDKLEVLKDISVEQVSEESVPNYQVPTVDISVNKRKKPDPMVFKDLTPEEKVKIKKNEFFKDKEVQRRHKLINEYTLSNIPRRKIIKPFEENYLNVLTCLLYGFSTQLAIYSGKENKYVMKYSLLTPTLNDTCLLNLRDDKPNVILYKECQLNSYGGKDHVDLIINTAVPNKVLSFFLDRTES